MAALSTPHRMALAALVDRCPETVLTRLRLSVGQMGGARAAELLDLIEEVRRDRRRRAVAFGPLLPLFRPRTDGVEGLSFPAEIEPRLWTAAVRGHEAHLDALDRRDAAAEQVADRLCRTAAGAVRDRPDEVWPRELSAETREQGLHELAGCLDLAPLCRQALAELPGWLNGRGDDGTGLRLVLKDAGAVAPEGAMRLMEILFAHMADAPDVLRIVTRTSAAAARETFLGGSELAGFVSRIVRALKLRTEAARYRPDQTPAEVAAIVEDLRWAADAIKQMDISLEKDPQGEWSRELAILRRDLAVRLGAWIRDAERAVTAAAPRARVRLGLRSTRRAPDLDAAMDLDDARRAVTQAGFLSAMRGPAAVFGCETERRAAVEAGVADLADWADEAIHAVNGGEAGDEAAALAGIARVADVLAALEANEQARAVRRRLAVAGAADPDLRTA